MTNKEIIDGVNVSQCGQSYYDCNKEGQPIERIKCNREYKDRVYYCDEFENCNFKQLKRKEQECENLKSENFTFEELIKTQEEQIAGHNVIIDRFLTASGKSKDITQPEEFEEVFEDIEQTYSEYEELKKENEKLKSQITSQDCEIYDLKSKNDSIQNIADDLQRRNHDLTQMLETKEKECEVLKQSENEALEIIAELKNDYAELEKRHNDSFEQFKNLKKECSSLLAEKNAMEIGRDEYKQRYEKSKEELDKYLNQEEEEIRQLNNDNKLDDILESIKKANEQMEKESKYKQALDEIEEVCKDGVYDEYRRPLDECSVILNIINKVKEQ